jgi:hypothetical protein
MSELDRKILDVLGPAEAKLLGEPPLWSQVVDVFRGRKRWVHWLVAVSGVAFTVLMVVSVVRFFQAEDVKELIAWASGFGLSLIAVFACRLWFWLELHTNAVAREVKQVQLQLARLARQLGKAPAN